MRFEKIPEAGAKQKFNYYVDIEENFYHLVNDFELVGVAWSEAATKSDSYFLRLLQKGTSARAHSFDAKNSIESDEYSTTLAKYRTHLLDHGTFWKRSDGTVICTTVPSGSTDDISKSFQDMKREFQFPDSVKLCFLDDSYRFKRSGDIMVVIYDEKSSD